MLVTIEVVENEVFVVDGSEDRKNTVQSRSLKINAALSFRRANLGSIPPRLLNPSVIPRIQLDSQCIMQLASAANAIPCIACFYVGTPRTLYHKSRICF